MIARARLRRRCLLLGGLLLLIAAPGCAGWKLPLTPEGDIAETRRQRTDSVTRRMEAKRDFAEYQAAEDRFEQGDAAGCEEALQKLLERSPSHREALLLATKLQLGAGHSAQALQHAQQALDAYPKDPAVLHAMGLVLDATGQTTGALAYYEQAVELEPDNELFAVVLQAAAEADAPAQTTVGPTLPGPLLSPNDNAPTDNAPAGIATVSQRPLPQPTPSTAGFAIAEARSASPAHGGNDPSGSTVQAWPPQAGALIQQGDQALAQGAMETAIALYRDAAAMQPNNPQIPIAAAVSALRHNQPALAVHVLLPLRERFAGEAAVHRVLGTAYYRLGDYQSSQVALQQALSLDKSSALSYFLMGCTLARLGQSESAQAHMRQAGTINPRYAVRR